MSSQPRCPPNPMRSTRPPPQAGPPPRSSSNSFNIHSISSTSNNQPTRRPPARTARSPIREGSRPRRALSQSSRYIDDERPQPGLRGNLVDHARYPGDHPHPHTSTSTNAGMATTSGNGVSSSTGNGGIIRRKSVNSQPLPPSSSTSTSGAGTGTGTGTGGNTPTASSSWQQGGMGKASSATTSPRVPNTLPSRIPASLSTPFPMLPLSITTSLQVLDPAVKVVCYQACD